MFEERLREELSSRFFTFLDDEGVNFVDFVNALEEEAAERIFAHLKSTLDDQALSQPVSSPLGQSVPAFAAASSDVLWPSLSL